MRTLLFAAFWMLASSMPAAPVSAAWLRCGPTLRPAQEGPGIEAAPVSVPSPADRVTALVREAMQAPENSDAWTRLDLALAELDFPAEGSSPEGPRARPARTSSSAGLLRKVGRRGKAILHDLDLFLSTEPWAVPTLLVLGGVALLWIGRRSARMPRLPLRRTDRVAPPSPVVGLRKPRRNNPKTLAIALWEGGLPSPEIARRTGLAQDALAVLLAIRGKDAAIPSVGPRPSPPNPYAASGGGR